MRLVNSKQRYSLPLCISLGIAGLSTSVYAASIGASIGQVKPSGTINTISTNSDSSVQEINFYFDSTLDKTGKIRATINKNTNILLANKNIYSTKIANSSIAFADNGLNGDIRANDGVLSATIPFNTLQFLSEQAANISNDVKSQLNAFANNPKFDGRALVNDTELTNLLKNTANNQALLNKVTSLKSLKTSLANKLINASAVFSTLNVDTNAVPLVKIKKRGGLAPIITILGVPAQAFTSTPPSIDAAKSLMITNVNVVEDPSKTFDICRPVSNQGTKNGVWTFAYLIRQLAQNTGLTPEQYALKWLDTWGQDQDINQEQVSARINISKVIESWQLASQQSPTSEGELDIDYFPARLMAIVNRPDVGIPLNGGVGGYGGKELKRGEARLVFTLINKGRNGNGHGYRLKDQIIETCESTPFTVIAEYNTPAKTCLAIKNWQKKWKALEQFNLGSVTYNNALADITNSFTMFGANSTSVSPNKSLLAQLRTNENFLDPLWQLREFSLINAGDEYLLSQVGMLNPATVKLTPQIIFNNEINNPSNILANFVNSVQSFDFLPLTYLGERFRAGKADIATQNFHWNYYNSPSDSLKRHTFSLSTCNGCHARETNTNFTHIGDFGKRTLGTEAKLSGFLTGSNIANTMSIFNAGNQFPVSDPVVSGIRNFNDIARRQQVMSNIINLDCNGIMALDSTLPIAGANFDMPH